MKRNGKQVCVIGLGHFGAGLSRALAAHCEVLAVDSDINRINDIADTHELGRRVRVTVVGARVVDPG